MVLTHKFIQNQAGSVAMYFGLLIGLILLVLAFALNFGTTSYYKTAAQNSLDAAMLAAVSNVGRATSAADMNEIEAEANRLFLINLNTRAQNLILTNVEVTQPDGSDSTYKGVVTVTPNRSANDPYFYDYFTAPMTLTSVVGFEAGKPTEVALAIDTSLSMSGGKLDSAKGAINTMLDQIFVDESDQDNTHVSIVPFSDAVKITPSATSNQWLQVPYSSASYFDGCMSRRTNGALAYNDNNPNANGNASKFPRYIGPFDEEEKIKIEAYRVDGTKQPILRFVTEEVGTNTLKITLLDKVVCGNDGPCTLDGNGGHGSRFNPEIDYADNIDGLTGSERLVIDYGTMYRSAVSRVRIYWMFEHEREIGGWRALDASNNVVTSGEFDGAPGGQTFDLLTIMSPTPMQKLEFYALDNGNPFNETQCPIPGRRWGTGASQTSACVNDNTDYGIEDFDYDAKCSVSAAALFKDNKTEISSYIDGLQTDGPTRTDRGLAWAYYALSPEWRGVLPGSLSTIPASYDNSHRKIAVLLSNAANYGGAADNESTLRICEDMKQNGILIYTISFGAPNEAKTMLQECASTGGNYYFDAPSGTQLTEAFKSIARDITTLKLLK